jgi:Imidazolonepropionase and related amidohydrolases
MHHDIVADVWDGRSSLGVRRVRWSDAGRDGAVESIEDAGSDAVASLALIPGLIDTHVHLLGYAGDGPVDFLSWPLVTRPEEQVLHGLANARKALASGVTTLRDLSADEAQFSLARALEQRIVDGPRVLADGMVGMTGGHADLFTPPAVAQRKPVADGPDECRRLVRHWARAGANGIKIATSGGVLSVGDKASWRNHTREEIRAIVDEAHALGLPVAAHAHTEAGIAIALEEGVDSVEHATLMTAEQATAVAAAGITVAPTLLINDRIAEGSHASAEQAEKARMLVAERDERFADAASAGVDFVLGTDANALHVRFGDQLDEIRAMSRVFGWSAERSLQAATSFAGRAIGRPDLGVIEPTAPADFVLIDGRPWEDLDQLTTERIVAVVSRGRVVHGSLSREGRERQSERKRDS